MSRQTKGAARADGQEAGEWYTPQEVAGRCGLSRRRVYDWLTWGWLRGHRRGGRWAVTADDWEFFQRTCRGAGGRLMPSLRDWSPLWAARDAQEGRTFLAGGGPGRAG